MKRHLAALALLLSACAPALAQTDPLAAQAGIARYTLAGDPGVLFDHGDEQTREVFLAALGGDHGNLNDLWAQIMAGAVQIRRNTGSGMGEVLWYSSLFDSAIASRWQQGADGAWRAVAATPVSGEALRGETTRAEPVAWPDSGSLKLAIEERARRTVAAAQAGGWLERDHRGSGTAALIRAMGARQSLNEMRSTPGYAASLSAAVEVLVSGRQSVTPEANSALVMMGPAARMTLRPVAAFRRVDGWTIAMQSPDTPRWTWLVHASDPETGGGEARIAALQLVNSGGGQ